ncbi:MAG TPA: EAL domain-containing protein [Egibacteraceae bacterium]|nr:EAL domain-containing protein [Egibacteraceae bacterium]
MAQLGEKVGGSPARAISALRQFLPAGDSLDAPSWRKRHRAICGVLWAHVPAVAAFALVRGETAVHSLGEAAILAVLAAGASVRVWPDAARAVMATLGLVSASAIAVHLSGGVIEMHFHFFVVVVIASLYQSWVPFLVALAFVVLHHGIVGQLAPESVFNHPAALAGAWRWAAVHGAFVLAESAACLAAWRLNETALEGERAARVALERSNADLLVAQRLSSIGSWDWEIATDTVWWSRELYTIFGVQPDEFLPSVAGFLAHVHEDDRGRVALLVEQAGSVPAGDLEFNCRVLRADGTERIVHALGHAAVGDDGRPTRLMGTVQDITERKALEREIEYRAFHDPLTDLANRALFMDRVRHALAVRERTGASIAVLYLDLDDFKTVNDTLGHSAGDALLVQVAHRLCDSVRTSDTVARLGGDEFAVLLENTDTGQAARAAEAVLDALQEPVQVDRAHLLVRTSIGVVVAERSIESEELLRRADVAMYEAKRQGKHMWRAYGESMQSSLSTMLSLEAQVPAAVEAGEFLLHVQPVVSMGDGTVRALEVLVRWRHPQHGILPASAFVPVAEETGVIGLLGEWILTEAVQQACWMRERLGRVVPLSLSVSPRQLHGDVAGLIEQHLAAADLAADCLLVEVGEDCLGPHSAAVPKLAALRAAGARVVVGDFGTGRSSLAGLRQMPVDALKIDRSFVRNVVGGPEESAMAQAIVKLAALFGLRTIAEGVETAEQAAVLRSLGCDDAQGHHFARPMDPRRFATEVEAGRLRLPDAHQGSLHPA